MATTPVSHSAVITGINGKLPIIDEATTSRVVVNNAVLRHVIFTFDKGQLLTDHASPRAVIVNILEGAFDFTVGGVKHTVSAGDVVYLAPGERHALVALEPSRMSLTLVDVDALASGAAGAGAAGEAGHACKCGNHEDETEAGEQA
ncbi:MAG: cupin domain-containing protein [Bifidobacteriaceae bacterium]|nr:cupin domain-containing protein [Bifidobacteriaceae bacterium]